MEKANAHILVIDDDPAVLTSAKLFLKQKFSFVKTLPHPEQLEKVLEEVNFDLILLDMNYNKGEHDGAEGLKIIERTLKKYPGVEIVPVTAYGEIELAVDAMKLGARDFITKPWENERLYTTLLNILDLQKASRELERLKDFNKQLSMESGHSFGQLIGESSVFLKVLKTIGKVAPTDANILILGENGTGKELVAQAIHRQSLRKNQPFVKVDLGSLPESLFESELFGHVKGAYTDAHEDREGKFQISNGGTLFLDEIGNINFTQQAKILTAIQNKSITRIGSNQTQSLDIRLICATNIDIYQSSQEGTFRQDLLYRINTIEIELPPLRDRREDIPILAMFYLEEYKKKYQKPSLKIAKDAMKVLQGYSWPGNVRELSHVIERAVILSDQSLLTSSMFHLEIQVDKGDTLNLKDMEKRMILKALERNKGNITHAARELGIDRLALYRRLEKYGL